MKKLVFLSIILLTISCTKKTTSDKEFIRPIHDTIGFAQYDWQLDSIYNRLQLKDTPNTKNWKTVISPHDDYKYAGKLYHTSLKGVNAKTIILIGVAHRAKNYSLQDKIIFGNYTHWKSPYGKLKVTDLNTKIQEKLSKENFMIHDSMQALEHSLEAIVPFLHKKNRNIEIVPILIPYINYETMNTISTDLSQVVSEILKANNLQFGKDVAIVISNDAVHYGTENWGRNLAPYGVDSLGTAKARNHDKRLINDFLTGEISMNKVKNFTQETVQENDYKEYKWVWCGRYSVPFGLAFANKLNLLQNNVALTGNLLGYASSIDHALIKVEDLKMGTTAIATQKHWVAYASIKYE
ncbi:MULTISPECIES: AmmeMemoRadiSam system protein B [unclassified Polaribacter]|uniref:AmmeMemoRadiSam system protein B n=1 Tax=unclassified Polaribacter TaxID=196858 RepID=UPI0011BF0E5C|nr:MULTISPECIES: AmmeMemoRadiSam system protein B [unclassified Polaribacter]TXD52958.1 AmmeMemoRadiSam system protein B [Polaribacter sp. IC063]TXD60950.1 AmmeMemoRadiSam system protein B [Polaribacter sp. IC066]